MEWLFKWYPDYGSESAVWLMHKECNSYVLYNNLAKYVLICGECQKKVPADIVSQIKLLNNSYHKAIIPSEDLL